MINQNCLLCLFQYILIVGINVPLSACDSINDKIFLDIPNNLKLKSEIPVNDGKISNNVFDDIQKRKPKMFLGMRGKKIPSGFMGLRGRRIADKSQKFFLDRPMLWGRSDIEDDIPREFLMGKRVPISFMGMRGMKLPSGLVSMRGRRIPVAFLGMRGKKSEIYNESEDGITENFETEDKRTPQGFLGMRGKKEDSIYSNEILSDNLNFDSSNHFGLNNDMDYHSSSLIKRAPLSFLGMRG